MRNYEEILKPAIDYLKSLPIETTGDKVLSLYYKTPNIFYKTKRVYIRINNGQPVDITDSLRKASSSEFNLQAITDIMSVAYHMHFMDEGTIFHQPYYVITVGKSNGEWSSAITSGSESPDPIDSNGTVIRK